jgi:aminoglycoside phosphotransferase (APT) family kinase protein
MAEATGNTNPQPIPGASEIDLDELAAAIREAPDLGHIFSADLRALDSDSVSHSHYRIGSTGFLLRAPRFSHWDQDPETQITYEAEAFKRAYPSGYTPQLYHVLPSSEHIRGGALIVEEIHGTHVSLDGDCAMASMHAIAVALASLHQLQVPATNLRAPLHNHLDPRQETLAVIESHISFLPDAGLSVTTSDALTDELEWARTFATKKINQPMPMCLVGTDTHPGNFLIDSAGKAWFVDLEKLVYGHPAIDLAHATLPTSTGWDRRSSAHLTARHVGDFYQSYLELIEVSRAAQVKPWLTPMRRLTWLRTMSWFIRWRVDWSRQQSTMPADIILKNHIDTHIDWCFESKNVAEMRAEWLEGPEIIDF